MDFSKLKFGCSILVKIMSNSRAVLTDTSAKQLDKLQAKELKGDIFSDEDEKKLQKLLQKRHNSEKNAIVLSVGSEKFLRGIYLRERYGARYKLLKPEQPRLGVPQMVRGIKTENQALNLLCEIDNTIYYVSKKQVENEYLTAKLDVIDKPTVEKSTKIFDIKSSQDAESFFEKIDSPFTTGNILQMQGYFGITGIEHGEIVHCLVGEPEDTIDQQEELLFNKMCPDGKHTVEFVEAWQKALDSMLYNDIPAKDRLISLPVSRDNEKIDLIYETIIECRKWLMDYHEIHETFTAKRYIG
jgi:hypothetical protein